MADIVQKSWGERQWMPTETAGSLVRRAHRHAPFAALPAFLRTCSPS